MASSSSKSMALPEEGKVRRGKGLFSENGVWVNPQTVRDMAESLHMNPEWVTALFGDEYFDDYPDDDEMHALLTFSFLDRVNEDIRNLYLPWADEVIGVKPEPMEWRNAEPEPEYQSLYTEASIRGDVDDDDYRNEHPNEDHHFDREKQPVGCEGRGKTTKGVLKKASKEEKVLKSGGVFVDKERNPEVSGKAHPRSGPKSPRVRAGPLSPTKDFSRRERSGRETGVERIAPLAPEGGERKAKRLSFQVGRLLSRRSIEDSELGESCAPLGKACFCGAFPIARPVVLRCRHRFCLKHLFALKQRAGTAGGDSSIACPYCGDVCEYSISGGYLSIQNFKSCAYTSTYSYRFHVGSPRTTDPSLIVPSATRRIPEKKRWSTHTHLGPYASRNSSPQRYAPSKEMSPHLKLPLVFTPRIPAPKWKNKSTATNELELLSSAQETSTTTAWVQGTGWGLGFKNKGSPFTKPGTRDGVVEEAPTSEHIGTHVDAATTSDTHVDGTDVNVNALPPEEGALEEEEEDEEKPSLYLMEEESKMGELIQPHVTEFYRSTRLPMQPRKPSLGSACFCGASPPDKAVVLRCRHRFCLQHLAELRGRTETSSKNTVACPFCGCCTTYTISSE